MKFITHFKRNFTRTALTLLLAVLTTMAWAQTTIDLSTLTADYTAQDGDILTGTTNYGIIIPDGATITLYNAKILRSGQFENPVKCNGSATIIIADDSNNEIKNTHDSYQSVPGIAIGPSGSTFTLNGNTGELTVQGGKYAAGIGTKDANAGNIVINGGHLVVKSGTDGTGIGPDCSSISYSAGMGNITINGGTMTITGGSAGIGATDDYTSCGTITINDGYVNVVATYTGIGGKCTAIEIKDGTVYATGRNLCPGIGGHQCGPITISGGTVSAIANTNYAAGIGSGYGQTCGDIIITGGTVTATGGNTNAPGIGKGDNGGCGKIIIGKDITSVTAITQSSNPPINPEPNLFVASNITDVTDGNTRIFTPDPTAPEPEELEKDADGYYLIGTVQDWKEFRMQCAFEPIANARMTADIDLGNDQTVIGSFDTPYQGTFDGQGHALTMAYVVTDASSQYIAPFSRLDNATVQNLHVKGTITTAGMRPAGITSYVSGTSYVKNCWSEVDITSSRSGDIDAAGLVARINSGKTLRISDCVFTGSINYTHDNSYVTGGLVAWMQAGANVYMDNCLFAPSCIRLGTDDRNYMLVGAANGTATITNSYYNSIGQDSYFNSNPQGTYATDAQLTDGTIAFKLQKRRENLVWGQRIGIDDEPVLTSDESYRVYRTQNDGYTNDLALAYTGLEQDADGYYLLGIDLAWIDFAALVNGGTANANARMTADIDLGDDQTILGATEALAYKGTFDGQGHTLTVNLSSTANVWGPFRYVGDGATIQNLRVDGTVNGAHRWIGGFVGQGNGTYYINNCISSVTLNTTYSGDGVQGGFVAAQRGTLQISDCIFDGVFYGPNAYTWGGIVGWNYSTTSISNCLVLCDSYNLSMAYVATFIPNDSNITNCYYKTAIGTAQGTQATAVELADGTTAYKLQNNRADLVWGQRIGNDAKPVLTSVENYRVYKSINGGYTNDPDLAYTGLVQDAEGYYLLGSLLDWQDFATLVQTTPNANARMTADIDLGDDQTHIGNDPAYGGIFDGQGHTLNVNYYSTSSSTAAEGGYSIAPFRNINGATIKNLSVTGSITGYRHTAGVVGYTVSPSTNLISNVIVSATITATGGYAGGFIGHCETSTTTIQDCLFNGFIDGSTVGVFFGWSGYASMFLTNCMENGTYVNCSTFTPTSCPGYGTPTVTNCYYMVSGSYSGTQATAAQLADGTIAYKLQNNRADLVWGQRIGTDTAPVLTSDESYRVYYINGSYTNDPDPAIPCSDPAELSVTQTSYTSFTLAWTAGNSVAWDVQYRAIGALSWTSFGTVNVATCTLTDLEESTPYEAQVKATCSDTWVSFDNFTTSEIPAAIDVDLDHPFSVNFASLSAIPDNWIAVGWTLEANSYIYSGNTGTCYLYSPVLNITTGGKISVYSRTETINYSGNSSHTLTILATTDGGNTFEEATIPASATPNIEPSIYRYNIPSSWIGKQLQIVFKYETPGVGVNRWDIHKVDINVGTIFQNNNYNYDGNWTSSQNWTNGIPNENIDAKIIADVNIRTGQYVAAHNITISTGVTLTLYNNSSLTCNEITNNGTIVIQDGGQLICNNNPTVTMQKSITGYGNNNEVNTGWNFIASPITEELSPSSEFMLWNTYDLYRLNNTTWENYRAHTQDFTINNGKGYLYANSGNVTLSFTGTIKPFTTEGNANQVALTDGWNLVGNPYTFNVYSSKSYYKITTTTIDNVEQNVVTAVTSPSNYIAPCTAIVVKSTGIGSVAFTKTAPAEWSTGNQGNIQMTLAQQATNRGSAATIDNAIVSFNEGSLLGKFYFGTQKANLYIPQGTEEYAIAYSDGQGEMPINFRANENGQYTITVNPEGVEMAYLHLIDNMTGADVDLLQTLEYTFTAKTTDYESRFRLVFSVSGDANDDNADAPFAFINNGNIIVNGEGTVQVIDVMGRIIVSGDAKHCVSTTGMVPGVYVIRLIDGERVRTQKIIVR